MKAYVIEQSGGPEVLQLRDIPSIPPSADEVRIRVRAFGLNRAEVYRRAGKMGPIVGQVVPGIEAVGEIIEDVSGIFRVGQRVATVMGGLQFSRNGSYADEVTVLRSNVINLDGTTLSWEELAALPESYLTVWGALGRLIDAVPGQTVLIRGATSSVGQAGVTYAKARGQHVIATTRSAENAARLTAIGADVVIIDTGEIAEQVKAAAPEGVDVVLEVVGAATVRDSLKALKPFGAAVVIGLLGGAPSLDSLHLMNDLPNATSLAFFGSGLLGTSALPLAGAPLKWIADNVASGVIPSLRVQTFDFGDVRRAHSLIESDRALGKLVVRI
ncbi:zinc-binding dehydrogenase [Solimicrobium silvestre]|uniref:NADPH:quinone reductase and related Zn-dependent oxidoreductase n=1 Tax=Solimicrobium silvestre TaxID=2099400 RepID=A0A2S9H3P4_9BURK|nr:zinc-binding dehydrogenase [Solimicrobium silvestre]PRC94581.1 NADPH:quinone reductase and related Zn-dependent oxidoreductase [Solimicrobium silvestre]